MYKISKILPYFILLFLIGLAGCFAAAFFMPVKNNLLEPLLQGWKIRNAVLLFIFYFPFIYISTIILGYTIIFGKYGPVKMERRSPEIVRFIQSFFIVSMIAVSCYVILSEAVKPILLGKQAQAADKTESYIEYTKLAKEAAARKEYANALKHIKGAISIWPEGNDANRIYEMIKISDEEFCIEKNSDLEKVVQDLQIAEKLSPEAALNIAEKAMILFDLYTAHYYAKLAYQTFADGHPLKSEAENIAKHSWEEIEKGLNSSLEQPGILLFRNKKQAYEAMQAGNFIKAYYSFLQIKNDLLRADETKKDEELERFLNLAKANLEYNTFFYDEIENIPAFIINKNICFSVFNSATANSKINIYGIARTIDKKNNEVYLMNTEYSYYENGRLKYSILIPYSKLKKLENADGKDSLMLQIRPVDRNIFDNDIEPEVITGVLPKENSYNIMLPMDIEDFNLIETAASHSPTEIKLSSLYYFSLIAEKYGFTKAAYLREILFRLAKPMLLLIISVVAVILAWFFRLIPGVKFKKRWAIAAPLCPFLAYLLLGSIRYVCKLLIAFFVSVTPKYVSVIVFGMLILLFIYVVIRLLYQRSE